MEMEMEMGVWRLCKWEKCGGLGGIFGYGL